MSFTFMEFPAFLSERLELRAHKRLQEGQGGTIAVVEGGYALQKRLPRIH